MDAASEVWLQVDLPIAEPESGGLGLAIKWSTSGGSEATKIGQRSGATPRHAAGG
jgi:hypothetical protein